MLDLVKASISLRGIGSVKGIPSGRGCLVPNNLSKKRGCHCAM